MADTQANQHKAAVVASHVPGRIRFKLHKRNADRKTMEGVKHNLEGLEGIRDVRLNPACGSVTVRYDHSRHSMSGILGFLEDMDVIIESIKHLPDIGTDDSNDLSEFMSAVNDLNRRFYEATGLALDLKIVLPLAFLGAGIWSISQKGLMLEKVPGLLFVWLAFDIYVKMHAERAGRPGVEPQSA
ncbi:MAG: HMA2 domain-containing protein [Methylobacter sp.]